MKKTVFQIAVAVMLLLMGCSKDETITDTRENDQLKKGSKPAPTINVTSFSFTGTSVDYTTYFELLELEDGTRLLKKGQCSGTFKSLGSIKSISYGTINPAISDYNFVTCEAVVNNLYPLNSNELPYNYILKGSGKASINIVDFIEFSFVEGLYSPCNYKPLIAGSEKYKGGIFICNNAGQGKAIITRGSGIFSKFTGTPIQVLRGGSTYTGNDRITGRLDLYFEARLNN